MTIDLTIPSFLICGIVGYYVLLFAMSRPTAPPKAVGDSPLVVVLVPARNEELVIGATIENLLDMTYAGGEFRVLVVDDGSTDGTERIASTWADGDPRVRVLSRRPPEAGQGKSEALNHAYRAVCRWVDDADRWLDRPEDAAIVVAIVDADGRLQTDCLDLVAGYFVDPVVASVQIGVRIGNAARSGLARMQDMEFVGFSSLVQVARDRLGSSGLGGNGQFTRLDALISLGEFPWSPGALTEDLDLGLRLVTAGWRTRFCPGTYVCQQGLEEWRPLLRQRTRWIQGHYQCWKHISSLASARRVRWATRIDLLVYLLLVITVLLVSATVAAGFLGALGVITVDNNFLHFIPAGLPRRVVSTTLSVLPAVLFMHAYQRHSGAPFRWYEILAFGIIFTCYTYVWLITTLRAIARIVLRRNAWIKTPRVEPAMA